MPNPLPWLGPRLYAGGVGYIHQDPTNPDRLIKKFKQPLTGTSADRIRRLHAVSQWARPSDRLIFTSRFSWPIELFGTDARIDGFSMRLAPDPCWFELTSAGVTKRRVLALSYLSNSSYWQRRAVQSAPPDLSPPQRRELTVDIIEAITALHRYGLVYGDISTNNACAQLGETPSVLFFDTDSIGLPLEVEAARVRTADWEAPDTLDMTGRDCALVATLVWRILSEESLSYPTVGANVQLDTVGAGLVTPLLAATYQTGDSEILAEALNRLRGLRDNPTATATLLRARNTKYARMVLRETAGRTDAEAMRAREPAKTQVELERAIDDAPSSDRRRLINQAVFASSVFELDSRPDAGLLARPNSQGQLRERILDGEFAAIAAHLSTQGLGSLESDPWLPRAVQHALVQAGEPQLQVSTGAGTATLTWSWPTASFVNSAVVEILSNGRRPLAQRILRHPGESQGMAEIQSPLPTSGQATIVFSVQSPSGKPFLGAQRVSTRFEILTGLSQRGRGAGTGADPILQSGPAKVVDPVQVAANRARQRREARRRRTKRTGIVVCATAVCLALGWLGWDLVGKHLLPQKDPEMVFTSDQDGDWDIWVRRQDGQLEKLTPDDNAVGVRVDDRNPVWHPNGEYIAFESTYDGDWELLRMTADGTDVGQYTINEGHDDRDPAYSPDGLQLAYASNEDGDWDIWVRRQDGQLKQITSGKALDRNPVWHPNGDFIAFERTVDGRTEMFRVAPNGTAVRRYLPEASLDFPAQQHSYFQADWQN